MQLLYQCVCVCVFSGWRSMVVAAFFFFHLKIWSHNVSLTDYPQYFSPTQGPQLACRLERVCLCVSAGREQCRGQIYSARGLDLFCRGLWVFLESSSVCLHCCRCGTWLNYNCVLLLNRVTHSHTLRKKVQKLSLGAVPKDKKLKGVSMYTQSTNMFFKRIKMFLEGI